MTSQLSSDGFACVDPNYVLFDATQRKPPTKAICLCANQHTGKTIISTWNAAYGFTHWAPLPVFPKNHE
jgi:hypothetical protein